MATDTLSTGHAAAHAPKLDTTTRRSLILALAIPPIALGAMTTRMAAAPGKSDFNAKLAAFITADRRCLDHDKVYDLAKAHRASDLNKVIAESNRLDDLRADAIDAVVACPVFTPQDFARKIAFVAERDQWAYKDTQAAIIADANRLAKREG